MITMTKEFVSEEMLIVSQPIRYIKNEIKNIIDFNVNMNKPMKDRDSLEKIIFQNVYMYFGQCMGPVNRLYNPMLEKEKLDELGRSASEFTGLNISFPTLNYCGKAIRHIYRNAKDKIPELNAYLKEIEKKIMP